MLKLTLTECAVHSFGYISQLEASRKVSFSGLKALMNTNKTVVFYEWTPITNVYVTCKLKLLGDSPVVDIIKIQHVRADDEQPINLTTTDEIYFEGRLTVNNDRPSGIRITLCAITKTNAHDGYPFCYATVANCSIPLEPSIYS